MNSKKSREWKQNELDYIAKNFERKTYVEMSKDLDRSVSAVKQKSRKIGYKRVSKYTYQKDYFERIDTEEKAYWLGFIYADGYIVNDPDSRNYELGIELALKDEKHLKKFNKSISGNLNAKQRFRESEKGGSWVSGLRVYSKEMTEDLIKCGALQNKTFIIKFPEYLDSNMTRHFIRGYFDGDGSVYIQTRKSLLRCKFTSGSKVFVEGLQSILLKLDIGTYIVKYHNSYDLYLAGRENTKKFLEYIYDNSTISLDRKLQRYKTHKKLLLPR